MAANAAGETLRIGPASPETRQEALQLAMRDLAAENRDRYVSVLAAGMSSGDVPPEGLLEARRGGRLVGALFSQAQGGRSAVVWPPRIVSGEPAATAGQLLAAASELLAHQGVCAAHALLETVTEADDVALRASGFEPLAELIYLMSLEETFPRERPVGAIDFEPYCPANHDRLVRVVEATYERTLDCPQLDGVRDTENVLAGYRATGTFDPARWLIVQHQGQDVGCLLLADHPQDESWELVYMGLIVSARGRGWGRHIARYAQWLTSQAGRPRLVVAVDAANAPATRMYLAVGFQVCDRRSVYLKTFRNESGCSCDAE